MFGPPESLFALVDKYHLLPFVLLFLFIGLVSVLAMAALTSFRFIREVVDGYYDLRVKCIESRRRFEEATGKVPRSRTLIS